MNRSASATGTLAAGLVLATLLFPPSAALAGGNRALDGLRALSPGYAGIPDPTPPLTARPRNTGGIQDLNAIPWRENGAITKNPVSQNISPEETRATARFEGWYTRITDRDGQRSLAFIVGSFLRAGASFPGTSPMPGYLAVLVSDGPGAPLKVYETFPASTSLSVNGITALNQNPLEICDDGEDCPRSNFEWKAEGYGAVNNGGFSLTIPGEIDIQGDFGRPIFWNGRPDASPEGSGLTLTPIHWYVHSLGSPARYEYRIPAENIGVISSGYAHIEKNWGKSFPTRWIWSQGITDDNGSQYALAGGEVDLGLFSMTAFLAGIRTPNISWDFKPQQGTVFKTKIDACAGNFTLVLARPGKKLVIESSADVGTFGKVSIPTPSGFVSGGGMESFSATTRIEAYELSAFGAPTLVESKTFTNAALEFGANYMCGAPPAGSIQDNAASPELAYQQKTP